MRLFAVSVGIASTKTLSKIATEIVKKRTDYRGALTLVSLSEQELDLYLSDVHIEDVWSIGTAMLASSTTTGS